MRIWISTLLLILLVCLSFAAGIKGRVTSRDFPDGCPSADVLLFQNGQPTIFRTATDINGRYKIKDVPPGKYELHIEFLGYAPQVRQIELSREDTVVVVDVRNHIDIFRTENGLELSEFDAGCFLAGAEIFSRVDLGVSVRIYIHFPRFQLQKSSRPNVPPAAASIQL